MESTSMSRRGLGLTGLPRALSIDGQGQTPPASPKALWPPSPAGVSQSVSQSLSQHSQPLSAAQTIHGHCSPTLTVGSEDLPLLR
mmetsp:Transcript_25694/g.36844  ORF Transcript_25694/g.36844 Transcript_25694/m.36844 type:complete len:85 (+) Transcript_25694:175-429(+)